MNDKDEDESILSKFPTKIRLLTERFPEFESLPLRQLHPTPLKRIVEIADTH